MKNKPLIFLGGCVFLVIMCFLCAGLGVFGFGEVYKDLDELDIEYSKPEVIEEGDVFEWEIIVTNTGDKDIEIHEVEIEKSILEGTEVLTSEPMFTSEEDTSALGFELLSYYYQDLVIEAGETETITFEMKARESGSFAGTVTLYSTRFFNSIESYERFFIE